MASWSASGNLDFGYDVRGALRGIYPAKSNPESVSSWMAISPVTSTLFCSRSWISWRFAPVSEGRSPAMIQYLRDVGFCHSPKRAWRPFSRRDSLAQPRPAEQRHPAARLAPRRPRSAYLAPRRCPPARPAERQAATCGIPCIWASMSACWSSRTSTL